MAEPLKVAVNLLPRSRNRGVVKAVLLALAHSRLPAAPIGVLKSPSWRAARRIRGQLATLHQLREIGVCISMDDFGTGYSSLSDRRIGLPFDKIKIDRSFVSDLTERPDCLAISFAVNFALGISLGIATTAEGIEAPSNSRRSARGTSRQRQATPPRAASGRGNRRFLSDRSGGAVHCSSGRQQMGLAQVPGMSAAPHPGPTRPGAIAQAEAQRTTALRR